MKNCEMKLDGNILTITVDISKEFGNNDSDNQLIVCPNHHSIIHDVNPVFDRKRLLYIYPNGIQEGLVLNQHIG